MISPDPHSNIQQSPGFTVDRLAAPYDKRAHARSFSGSAPSPSALMQRTPYANASGPSTSAHQDTLNVCNDLWVEKVIEWFGTLPGIKEYETTCARDEGRGPSNQQPYYKKVLSQPRQEEKLNCLAMLRENSNSNPGSFDQSKFIAPLKGGQNDSGYSNGRDILSPYLEDFEVTFALVSLYPEQMTLARPKRAAHQLCLLNYALSSCNPMTNTYRVTDEQCKRFFSLDTTRYPKEPYLDYEQLCSLGKPFYSVVDYATTHRKVPIDSIRLKIPKDKKKDFEIWFPKRSSSESSSEACSDSDGFPAGYSEDDLPKSGRVTSFIQDT